MKALTDYMKRVSHVEKDVLSGLFIQTENWNLTDGSAGWEVGVNPQAYDC